MGATAEVTQAEFYPMERKVGDRFVIAEVEDDGGAVRRCMGMYIRHDPGTFKIVSEPTKEEEHEVVEFRVRQWNSRLNRWEWDTVTSTSEVNGEPYYCLASSAFVPAANWEMVDPEDRGDPFPPVEAGATAAAVAEIDTPVPDHDCMVNAVPYVSDGPLGHGWECGVCGEFLQAG